MSEPEQRKSGGWFGNRRIVRLMLLAALLTWGLMNFTKVCQYIGFLWGIAQPLVLGAAMAYVLELIVKYFEGLFFPKHQSLLAQKARRVLCVVLAALLLFGAVMLLLRMVIPGLADAISLLAQEIPVYVDRLQAWILENRSYFPPLADELEKMQLDWEGVRSAITTQVMCSFSGILSSTVSVITAVAGGVTNFFMSVIFAVFLLVGKKRLRVQYDRITRAFLPEKKLRVMNHVFAVAHKSFSGFIIGQSLDALLLGVMTALGMLAFGMPYAVMVGVISGTTGLIPILGGYIGAIIGAFLVFTVSPVQAFWFLVFIIVLQQVSGNLIYPRLVGSNIGLPGMWVLVAVTIGGGLGGIGGMLIGVPIMATIYTLLREWVSLKEKQRAES